MKMRESRNATLKGSTRGGNVTEGERGTERGGELSGMDVNWKR